ncbi:MAG TPA: ATP-binding protein [Mycobacteriales bacterium]|nr:ATP-binding protein [Mycobacteriales bacterium]
MTPRVPKPQTRVRIPLPDDATAPMVARRTLRKLLRGWRLPALVEPVVLAASELVTNAFRHGAPPVRLTVRRSADRVSIAVADSSDDRPHVAAPATAADESGRGMAIVDLVASDTGMRAEPAGKVVWAGFDIDRGE